MVHNKCESSLDETEKIIFKSFWEADKKLFTQMQYVNLLTLLN